MHRWRALPALMFLLASAGCQEEKQDPRLAKMAQEVVHEQSQQNQRVSEAHSNLTEGSKLLVEADANARRDLAALQNKLREDQAVVGQQRDALEAERKRFALERRQESLIGSSLLSLAILLACLAPLILAGLALLMLNRAPIQEEETEILIRELVQALEQDNSPAPAALPAPEADPLHLPSPAEPR